MCSSDLAAPRGHRWRIAAWVLALGLWLLPLVAMQFTAEVNWTASDFVVWAIMLGLAAGLFDRATRASGHGAFRLGAAIAIGTACEVELQFPGDLRANVQGVVRWRRQVTDVDSSTSPGRRAGRLLSSSRVMVALPRPPENMHTTSF